MKTFLLFRDRDASFDRHANSQDDQVIQDLELKWIVAAMANGNKVVARIAEAVMLASLDDIDDIQYRQSILADCIAHPDAMKRVAVIANDAIAGERSIYRSSLRRPSSTLQRSLEVLEVFLQFLRQLRRVAGEERRNFESDGLTRFFQMVIDDLNEDYLRDLERHMDNLRFRNGVLVSAGLGKASKGINYSVRTSHQEKQTWRSRLTGLRNSNWFEIAPRDDAGVQALAELRDHAIASIATALAQSCEHILQFFTNLSAELACYLGCVNLYAHLAEKGRSVCRPRVLPGGHSLICQNLADVALVIRTEGQVIGNDLNADGRSLVMITGAKSGGKSTFLRSLGQAQLMMQCGMFVCASTFWSSVSSRLFTHFIREEDATMTSGRLDEELSRMSSIIDVISPSATVLFNESFAATNEREGSEIASHVIRALLEKRVRVFFVTHLYDLAERFHSAQSSEVMFLRADRREDGLRTFKIIEGPPLETSFGEDILKRHGGWRSDVRHTGRPEDSVGSLDEEQIEGRGSQMGRGPICSSSRSPLLGTRDTTGLCDGREVK